MHFIRVGTLDQPGHLAPYVHIFTSARQPWFVLPPGTPVFEEYYDRKQVWSADRLHRREALLAAQKPG